MSKIDENTLALTLIYGILIGAILSAILIWATATNAIGFGLKCANKVLNNPEVYIDTIYTIHQQDTIVTYNFVKDRKCYEIQIH